MNFETITLKKEEPFAFVTLNRPDVRNAMNQQMISELLQAFNALREDRGVRGIVLSGAGGTFCAGGDLKEMQSAYANPQQDKSDRTQQFDLLLRAVNSAPQVVIAKVEGAAMGGGFGLVCVSDFAITTDDTIFGLPEVRLGIVPALISPYVIQRIGLTHARRLMLTGARFDGVEAAQYQLVHEVCLPEDIEERVEIAMADVRECAPGAIAACKKLILEIVDEHFEATAIHRAELLNELRRGKEGQEGMLAFIRKRKPRWSRNDERPVPADQNPDDTRF